MGRGWRPLSTLVPLLCTAIVGSCVFAAAAAAGPLADYGDAPDGARAGYLTAPSVIGHFPSKFSSNGAHHTAPGAIRLGQNFDLEPDSRQVNLDSDDDGFFASIKPCKTSVLTFVVNAENLPASLRAAGHTAYLNAWFDWNRDGRWNGSSRCGGRNVPEWDLQNHPVDMASFASNPIQVIKVPVVGGPQALELWVRGSLTLDQQFTSPLGQGSFDNGETEDYLIHEPSSIPSGGGKKRKGGGGDKKKKHRLIPDCDLDPVMIRHNQTLIMPLFFWNPITKKREKPGNGTAVKLINGTGPFGKLPGDVNVKAFNYGFSLKPTKDTRLNPFEQVFVALEVKGPGIRKIDEQFDCEVDILHDFPLITEQFGGGQPAGPPSGLYVPPLSVLITEPTDDPAFVDDNDPVLQVSASASGGSPPYAFNWQTSPSTKSLSGQNQTLDLSSWPISLENGRATGTYTATATDSQGRTANTSWNVVVACNTSKVVTADIGGGTQQLFQACAKINTHGVQPAKVVYTAPMGNNFSGNFRVWETVKSSAVNATSTQITAMEPKPYPENPFGYVGILASMASVPSAGQCIHVEVFDNSDQSLGTGNGCL